MVRLHQFKLLPKIKMIKRIFQSINLNNHGLNNKAKQVFRIKTRITTKNLIIKKICLNQMNLLTIQKKIKKSLKKKSLMKIKIHKLRTKKIVSKKFQFQMELITNQHHSKIIPHNKIKNLRKIVA